MNSRGCSRRARADHLARHQAPIERPDSNGPARPGYCQHRSARQGGWSTLRRHRLARASTMSRSVSRADCLGHRDMRIGEARCWMLVAAGEQVCERCERCFEIRDELEGIVLLDLAEARRARTALLRVLAPPRAPPARRQDPRRHRLSRKAPRSSVRAAFRISNWLRPSSASGCLSKAMSAGGAKLPSTAPSTRSRKAPGTCARHRYAGRIVNRQIVALEPCGNAPRQHTVRRDQRGGLAGSFDAGFENQRDGLGLVMRGRRDDEANPGKSVGEARAPIRQEIAGGEKFSASARCSRQAGALRSPGRAARALRRWARFPERRRRHRGERRACATAQPCRLAGAQGVGQGSPTPHHRGCGGVRAAPPRRLAAPRLP